MARGRFLHFLSDRMEWAASFAGINALWWAVVFCIPASKRNLDWGFGILLGVLPCCLWLTPLKLLGKLFGADWMSGWDFGGAPGNEFRLILIGMFSWALVGYGVGFITSMKGRSESKEHVPNARR